MRDRNSRQTLNKHTGHNYLYTGDIHPSETACFALENGKHFYVYSLPSLNLVKRVTLPKYYESIDVCGHYTEDGKFIQIPAYRWVDAKSSGEGHYEYVLFKYETDQYTLVNKTVLPNHDGYHWNQPDLWDPIRSENNCHSM